jgi:hypothetical protein
MSEPESAAALNCRTCGERVRRTRPDEGYDLDECPWTHESGGPVCDGPPMAWPEGTISAKARYVDAAEPVGVTGAGADMLAAKVRPSGFPGDITRWIEDQYPPVKVLSVDVPPATAGKTTITIAVTVKAEALPDEI